MWIKRKPAGLVFLLLPFMVTACRHTDPPLVVPKNYRMERIQFDGSKYATLLIPNGFEITKDELGWMFKDHDGNYVEGVIAPATQESIDSEDTWSKTSWQVKTEGRSGAQLHLGIVPIAPNDHSKKRHTYMGNISWFNGQYEVFMNLASYEDKDTLIERVKTVGYSLEFK